VTTNAALSAFADNPQHLERARARFNRPLRTPPSAATTEPGSPDLRTAPQRRWQRRRDNLRSTYPASRPSRLFDAQVRAECRWIQADSASKPRCERVTEAEQWGRACANVRFRWVIQGIWRDEWTDGGVPFPDWGNSGVPFSGWKHEDVALLPSDEPEPESENELEAEEEQEGGKGEVAPRPKAEAEPVEYYPATIASVFGPREQGGETEAAVSGTEAAELGPGLDDSSGAEAQGDDDVSAKQPASPLFRLFGTVTKAPPSPGLVGLFGSVAQPARHPSPMARQEKPRPGLEGLPPWPQHDKALQLEWLARRTEMLERFEEKERRATAQRIRAEVQEHERRREEEQEERDREASRPYHQFLAQVSLERDRILAELNRPKPPPKHPLLIAWWGDPRDIEAEVAQWERDMARHEADERRVPLPIDANAIAYERVKAAWTEWHVWNPKWGVLPGMSWHHEVPFDEYLRAELGDEPADDYESPRDIAAREGLADFVARLRNFHSMSPCQSPPPHGLEPASKPTHDGEAAPPIPASVVDDETGASVPDTAAANMAGPTPTSAVATIRPPTPPISRGRPGRKGKQKGFITGPAARRGRRKASPENEADKSEIERSALGQVGPSRVSKAYHSPQPAARGRRKVGRAVPAPDPPPLEEPDPSLEATQAAVGPPRKSKRLLEVAGKRDTDTEGDAGGKLGAARRPQRRGAGVSRTSVAAAKPQGVTKPRAKRTRGKPK